MEGQSLLVHVGRRAKRIDEAALIIIAVFLIINIVFGGLVLANGWNITPWIWTIAIWGNVTCVAFICLRCIIIFTAHNGNPPHASIQMGTSITSFLALWFLGVAAWGITTVILVVVVSILLTIEILDQMQYTGSKHPQSEKIHEETSKHGPDAASLDTDLNYPIVQEENGQVYQKNTSKQEIRLPEEPSLASSAFELIKEFEELEKASDVQQRGYHLEKFLNHLFHHCEIPVYPSFIRNDRGEQIDGAFQLNNSHYFLVECKWHTKLTDIRQLDGLKGKVDRSGKLVMGLFLSINGWTEHVPQLLKQNPEKSIVLMDGDDLRGIIYGKASLRELLKEKITYLSIHCEPYLGIQQYLDNKNTLKKKTEKS